MNLIQINNDLKELDNDFLNYHNFNETYVIDFIENLKKIMFPNIYKNYVSIKQLYIDLSDLLISINHDDVDKTINLFFESLVNVKKTLLTDLDAFIKKDPAAKSKEDIILSYNSFKAIYIYRIANLLNKLEVNIIPRYLSEYAHSITGIDIHPKSKIGKYFFIDHGTGIVIGETSTIGENVSIYQGVTLGAKSLKEGSLLKGVKRHPTISDDVVIYANATILGGDTIIKKGSIISGNAFITNSN